MKMCFRSKASTLVTEVHDFASYDRIAAWWTKADPPLL